MTAPVQPAGGVDVLAVMDRDRHHANAHRAACGYRDSQLHAEESESNDARAAVAELMAERNRLHNLVNNPLTENFLTAVGAEVAHQIERWGTVHDRAKEPADWFWLVGYLAGKALASHIAGNEHKALHHTISTAAVLANWHAHITLQNGGTFTPGASDLQAFLERHFGIDAIAACGGAP